MGTYYNSPLNQTTRICIYNIFVFCRCWWRDIWWKSRWGRRRRWILGSERPGRLSGSRSATSWWRQLSTSFALWEGIHQSPVVFPRKEPVMRSFNLFVVRLGQLLNKQSSCQWFDAPWRLYDGTAMCQVVILWIRCDIVVFPNVGSNLSLHVFVMTAVSQGTSRESVNAI